MKMRARVGVKVKVREDRAHVSERRVLSIAGRNDASESIIVQLPIGTTRHQPPCPTRQSNPHYSRPNLNPNLI